jgi:hypothetical protein
MTNFPATKLAENSPILRRERSKSTACTNDFKLLCVGDIGAKDSKFYGVISSFQATKRK